MRFVGSKTALETDYPVERLLKKKRKKLLHFPNRFAAKRYKSLISADRFIINVNIAILYSLVTVALSYNPQNVKSNPQIRQNIETNY